MTEFEMDEIGDATPRIAGFIDIMSSVTLVFLLMTSMLVIVVYKRTLDKAALNDDYARAVHASKRYKVLADSLLMELEKRKITKIIIPNELEGKVFFESGRATILPGFYQILDGFYWKIADSLGSGRYNLVQVEGHTDEVPIRKDRTVLYHDNWDLGAARAIAVIRYLQKKGIHPQFLSATTHSEFKPSQIGNSEYARSQNRRIEIVLLKK